MCVRMPLAEMVGCPGEYPLPLTQFCRAALDQTLAAEAGRTQRDRSVSGKHGTMQVNATSP
jgi:hypothetical protein